MKKDQGLKTECKVGCFFSFCKDFIYNTLIKVVGTGNIPDEIAY
jgi:hypothetical protein